MKRMFLIAAATTCWLTLAGCKKAVEVPTNQAVLHLPITTVTTETVYQKISLPALVTPLPDHAVKVSPAIAGKLTAVLAAPGEMVQKGQLVATLDSRQLADQVQQAHAKVLDAQANVSQAQTNLQLAQNTEERTANLVRLEVGAEKDLVAAQSQVKTAKAVLLSAQAKLQDAKAAELQSKQQLSLANIVSPISGVVANRFLDIGDSTDAATPIVLIENLSEVVVVASLPASEPQSIKSGDRAAVAAPSLGRVNVSGTVLGVNPTVENSGTTVGVRILCNNPGYLLKDGMPVTATVVTAAYPNSLVVPITALVDDPSTPSRKMVYVEKNSVVTRVPVTTGIHSGSQVQILSGLYAGERIVAAGAYGVPDGTKIATK